MYVWLYFFCLMFASLDQLNIIISLLFFLVLQKKKRQSGFASVFFYQPKNRIQNHKSKKEEANNLIWKPDNEHVKSHLHRLCRKQNY